MNTNREGTEMPTTNRPPFTFAPATIPSIYARTKLFHGMHNGEMFLFRVWRAPVDTVEPAMMEHAGLNPHTNPLVYFVARDSWQAPAFRSPSLYLAGPLTLDGAAAVVRSFTEAYDRNTNYGAF